MITNTGKGILAKYLLGHTPAYASYIAVGCGAKPIAAYPTDPTQLSNLKTTLQGKSTLDFEMFRIPITSRGFVNEDGVSKIVFTAELPTEERYEISEIGIYSAGANPSAASFDSRILLGFTQTENWLLQTNTTTPLPFISDSLDTGGTANQINVTNIAFQANSDNAIFSKTGRSEKYERGRYYNNMVILRGDLSGIFMKNDGNFEVSSNSNHIHLGGIKIDLTQNSPLDELRLAFSVLCKNVDVYPESVNVMLEFRESLTGTEYARFQTKLTNGVDGVDFSTNRYFVVTKKLQDLATTSGFSWNKVNYVKIYTSTTEKKFIATKERTNNIVTISTSTAHGLVAGDIVQVYDSTQPTISGIFTVATATTSSFTYTAPGTNIPQVGYSPPYSNNQIVQVVSENAYVALDGLRMENVNTQNPLYGLVGYSLIKNTTVQNPSIGSTITKSPNSNNYIEFRFTLDVT